MRGGSESLRAVDEGISFPDRKPPSRDVQRYTQRLLAAIEQHRGQLDSRIEELAENWRLSRMTAVDRNILRIAAAEMIFLDEIPLRVSLQEAIRLAEWFGTEESRRFINGVLDGLLRELEPGPLTDAE
jgi:N utilization substance protein B